MYIPKELLWFLIGFVSCVLFSWIFSLVVEEKETEIDIDKEITIFKSKIRSLFKRTKKAKKQEEKKLEKELTKKETQKKLDKMFKEQK